MEKIKNVLLCCSSIDWTYIKLRIKKCNSGNWPELTTYCGCCTLPHGIYIRSVITAIVVVLFLVPDVFYLRGLIETRDMILSGNMSFLESRTNGDLVDRSTILAICKALIVYCLAWLSLRVAYILFVAWTMYAVYAKHSRTLKIILYVNLPLWFIEFFLTFINLFFFGYEINIIMIINHISEIYNILAIRSYYMKLRGKSRLVPDAIAIPNMMDANSTIVYPYIAIANGKHCRTCTCTVRRNTLGSDVYISTQSTTLLYVQTNENTPIESTSIVESVVGGISVLRPRDSRPLSLDLPLNKVDFSDEPVIYDKAQLNIGSSPVLEDRCYTSL